MIVFQPLKTRSRVHSLCLKDTVPVFINISSDKEIKQSLYIYFNREYP